MRRVPVRLCASNSTEGLASASQQYCTDWAANGHSCSQPVAAKRGDVGDVVEAADGRPLAALLSSALQFRDQLLHTAAPPPPKSHTHTPRYQPPPIINRVTITDPGTVVYGQSPMLTGILTKRNYRGNQPPRATQSAACCFLLWRCVSTVAFVQCRSSLSWVVVEGGLGHTVASLCSGKLRARGGEGGG